MTLTTRTKLMTAFAAAAMTFTAVAAHAEKKPTVLLVHRANQADADWRNLSLELAGEGYRVLSTKVPASQTAEEERAGLVQLLANEDNNRLLVVTSEPAGSTVSDFAGTLGSRVKGVVYLTSKPTVAAVSATPQYFVNLTPAKSARIETKDVSYTVHAAGPQMVASTDDLVDVIEAVDAKKSQTAVNGGSRPTTGIAATTKSAAHGALGLK